MERVGPLRKYGVTKVALVGICMIAFSFFSAYILGAVFDQTTAFCVEAFPYLPCDYTNVFLSGTFGTLTFIWIPRLSFGYLAEQSMAKVALMTILLLGISVFGVYLLRKSYEQSLETK